jgi:type IV pilus assembly protein PilW
MRALQRGMSLVEVMVAVVIGMIGILIIMQAYLTSDNFNRSTLGEGGAQINGAVALFTVERDLRMSGYGINSSSLLNCNDIYWYYEPNYSSNVTPGSPLPKIKLTPVYIDSTVTPHVITVMYATGPEMAVPSKITGFKAASSEIDVSGTLGFRANDLILLVNGTGCTLSKITYVQGTANKLQVNPGVSAPYNPPAWGAFPTTYGPNDLIVNLGDPKVRSYSIVNNSLRVTDAFLQAAGATPFDLVDGIVDLRAQYGKDNGAGGAVANDGVVDEYSNVQPANAAEWIQVKSVRIGVLARIGNYEKPAGAACDATTAANAPAWDGGAFTVPEGLPSCYRYRVFETIVPLRNLIWSMP